MKMNVTISAAVVALAALLCGGAQASVIPVLVSVTPVGSNFLWSYSGQLAPDQGVTAGDQLVIVDFGGYVPGSVTSVLPFVTASVSNTLPPGMLLDPGFTDSSSIPDLIFTYNGPNYQTTGGPYPAQTDFSGLSAESIYSQQITGSFSAVAVKNDDGSLTGTTTYNVGEVAVPDPIKISEPATWAMFLIGFGGIGLLRRASRRKGEIATA